MRLLSLLIGLLSVTALLSLGTTGAWATEAPMPCHETGMVMSHTASPVTAPASPQPKPAKAMVMGCCVACLTPALTPPIASKAGVVRPQALRPAPRPLPSGLAPSPDIRPPRA